MENKTTRTAAQDIAASDIAKYNIENAGRAFISVHMAPDFNNISLMTVTAKFYIFTDGKYIMVREAAGEYGRTTYARARDLLESVLTGRRSIGSLYEEYVLKNEIENLFEETGGTDGKKK